MIIQRAHQQQLIKCTTWDHSNTIINLIQRVASSPFYGTLLSVFQHITVWQYSSNPMCSLTGFM